MIEKIIFILLFSYCFSKTHTVREGDICWDIANKYSISLDELYSLNPGINCNYLQIGQKINVSKDGNFFSDDRPIIQPILIPKREKEEDNSYQDSNFIISYEQFSRAVQIHPEGSPSKSLYKKFISNIANGDISSKRELAMFLTNILWESGGLVHTREIRCKYNGCPGEYRSPGDANWVYYYGRGFIQLTWSYNYKAASYSLYGDDRLVRNPDLVAEEDAAWAVSFWFWKNRVHSEVQGGSFGNSIRLINGGYECNPCREACPKRINIYRQILPIFGVHESPNVSGC